MSYGSEFLADHAFEIEHGLPIKELFIPTHNKESEGKNMGIPILILGESGTGKSASMRNFEPHQIALANVAGKPLPFKGRFNETINTDSYRKIKQFMKESKANVVVIDDAQYLMANEFMRRSTERGYDKFTEIAYNFWDLVQAVRELPPGKIVVFMSHIDRDASGNEKIKTIGKMLDEKITVEGMFTIVLKTSVSDGKFSFITQNSGYDTVKSPIGMFPATEIDNDLKAVVMSVARYYLDDEPAKPAEVAKPVEPPKPKQEEKPLEEIPVPDDSDVPFYDSTESDSEHLPNTNPETGEVVEDKPKAEPRKRRTRKERN